jgi:hypothetical protein
MHAMGIESHSITDSETDLIAAKQDQIFGRIVHRRRCLPIDLSRMPASDLMAAVVIESGGRLPTFGPLMSALQRYLGAHA